MNNREKFLAAYIVTLTKAVQANPDLYILQSGYPGDKLETPEEGALRLATLMFDTMVKKGPGHIMRDTPTFKSTCKQVGAKNTIAGLREFLGLP